MEDNKNFKELDAFAKKYIKEIKQDQPSLDFTSSIMQQIVEEKEVAMVFKGKSLISKRVWFLIAVIVLAIVLIPFKTSEKSVFNLPEVNFSFLDKIQFSNFSEYFAVSTTVSYSLFFFGLMVIAQVFFLKNHFNKKYE